MKYLAAADMMKCNRAVCMNVLRSALSSLPAKDTPKDPAGKERPRSLGPVAAPTNAHHFGMYVRITSRKTPPSYYSSTNDRERISDC